MADYEVPADVPVPDLITQDPTDVTCANNWVQNRFGASDITAFIFYTDALALINQLANKEYPMPWTPIEYEDVPLGGLDGLEVGPSPNAPNVDPITVAPVTFPFQPPEMPDIDLVIGDIPAFTAIMPNITYPDPPDVTWPVFTENPPAQTAITFPEAPDYDLPPLPQITTPAIPSPPVFNMPTFDAVFPYQDLTPPEAMFAWNEAEYDSDILQELQSKLLTDLQNGGTGLGAAIEAAIWARAIERQEIENEQTYDEALNFWSSRGYNIPPGALVSRLTEVRARIDQINEDLNNDILIQQSKLAQENTHFIISAAIDLEKMLMDEVNRRMDRAFQAAKYTIEGAILIYQAKVTAYQAQLEAYKVQADVYEVRIRGELAKVEIFRTQIEAAKLTVEMQAVLIDAYRAQLAGIQTLVETYKVEMQAAEIQAQIDKIRVDTFLAQVNAYTAQVGAVTARWNAYQAQLAGEATKADVFKSEAQAYAAQVQGYQAQADVQLTEAKILVEQNKGDVDTYRALIDKYKADVDNALAQAEIVAKQQGYEVSLYEADISKYATEVDSLIKTYTGRVQENQGKYELQIKEADVELRSAVAMYELEAEGIKASAQVAAQLGASALTSVNASAHVGYSESRSDNRGHSTAQTSSSSYSSHRDLSANVERKSNNTSHMYHHND